ncbi:Ethanolaminephosphotransferase 1 [Taenia crassiceps]|uniref:Ethanolaminephosphotransferase 1 n=1 Tax=Taenia crassiceps TaxID=6207 RepID=A0ABR4QFB2_9CEST
MPMFSETMIDGVRKHKYSCIDTSPLSNYVLHPFWNYIVQYCPTWVAPNILTIFGFGLTVLNFLMLTFYDWDFKSPCDGIDGKQARRLGLSSPLGELMDHCCDAWTAAFYPPILFSLFSGQVNSSILFTCEWIIICGFLLAHWEKSITGVLYLPWSYDLGQMTTVLLFVMTFFASPSIWEHRLPIIQMSIPELTPYVAHGVFWLCAIPSSVINVVVACNKDRAKVPTAEAVVRPFAGTVFVFLASWLWMTLSPTHIMEHSPRLFLLCGGTLAANITCRVILAEVTKTKAPMWCNLMGVYGLVVFVLCLGLPPTAAAHLEFPCLLALTSLITVAHLLFSGAVVNEMCEIFNIRAFHV